MPADALIQESDCVSAFVPMLEQVGCPLCGAEESRVVIDQLGDLLHNLPGEFAVVRCAQCRHCYLNPRPTSEELAHYYPPDYGPYHAVAADAAPDGAPAASRPPWYLSPAARRIPGLRRLYYWLSESHSVWIPPLPHPEARALEIGCSDGWFLDQLRDRGWNTVGVELSIEPALRARARGHEVHVGSVESVRLDAGSFDACCTWMVLEHLADPAAALRQWRACLRPGGWLAFSVPNFGCWERHFFGRYWLGVDAPRHLQHFEIPVLKRLLRDNGFVVERIIHQQNVLNLIASTGLWLKARPRSRRWGESLLRFTDHPRMWPLLALAPLAKSLAWIRQAGRLTVIARAG